MIDKYYEDIYNKIEHEIKSFFIPISIEKDESVKNLCKVLSKEFSSGERKSCISISCVECPFSNKLEHGCLQNIVTSLLRKDSSINFKVRLLLSYRKAGEYYLKHYCIEYKQEEMDV